MTRLSFCTRTGTQGATDRKARGQGRAAEGGVICAPFRSDRLRGFEDGNRGREEGGKRPASRDTTPSPTQTGPVSPRRRPWSGARGGWLGGRERGEAEKWKRPGCLSRFSATSRRLLGRCFSAVFRPKVVFSSAAPERRPGLLCWALSLLWDPLTRFQNKTIFLACCRARWVIESGAPKWVKGRGRGAREAQDFLHSGFWRDSAQEYPAKPSSHRQKGERVWTREKTSRCKDL